MPGNARGPRLRRVRGRAGGRSWPGTGFGSLAVLSLLLPVAVGFTKRRRVNDALGKPWLIPDRAPASLFSERERLQGRMAAKVPGGLARDFPSARKTARRSRDEVWAAVVDRNGATLIEARLPAADVVSSSTAPLKLLLLLGAGLRTNTSRPKIRTFEKMKRWLDSVYGIFLVDGPVQAMDYLTDRADEPCGCSIPGDVVGMINFFESLGNRPTSERVANSGLLRNLGPELQVAPAVDKPRVKKKAVPFLAVLLASWKTTVMDMAQPCYGRMLAWTKCLQNWAALETRDRANVSPQILELRSARLSGRTTGSMTTGAGKEIHASEILVSRSCWLVQADWIEVGLGILLKDAKPRGSLLPLPSTDLSSCSEQEATFNEMCVATRKLLADCRDVRPAGENAVGALDFFEVIHVGDPLRLPGAQTSWGEHSARATLTTWAAEPNCQKPERDFLGQWRPSESDGFVRNQVHMTDKIRKAVALPLKSKKTICTSDELTLKHLEKFCNKKGISAADVRDMVRAVGKASALFEPMASGGFDVVLETPAEEAPDPESDGPCADSSGPAQATASEDNVEEQACLSHGAWVISVARKTLRKVDKLLATPWPALPLIHFARPGRGLGHKTESLLHSQLCLDCFPRPQELETSAAKEKPETCRMQSEPTDLWAATGYRQALRFAWLLYDSHWSPDGLVRLALLCH